jgi:hypothetical protein
MSGVLRLTAYRDDASGPFNTPFSRAELRDLRIAEPQLEDYRLSPPADGRTGQGHTFLPASDRTPCRRVIRRTPVGKNVVSPAPPGIPRPSRDIDHTCCSQHPGSPVESRSKNRRRI